MPMVDFFHGCSLHLKDYRKPPAMQVISYRKNDSASMIKAIEETRIKVMPFLVKFFDSYSSLEGMYDLGDKMIPGFYEDVVIILQRIDEYIDIKDAEFSDTLKNAMSTLGNNPMMRMVVEREKLDLIKRHELRKKKLLSHRIGETEYEIYMAHAMEIKETNYSKLNKLIQK